MVQSRATLVNYVVATCRFACGAQHETPTIFGTKPSDTPNRPLVPGCLLGKPGTWSLDKETCTSSQATSLFLTQIPAS